MAYDDLDLPNKSGTRGKLGPIYTTGSRKRDAKRMGNRKMRHAVRRSLHVLDERDTVRTRPTTAWSID